MLEHKMYECCVDPQPGEWRTSKWKYGYVVESRCASCNARRRESWFYDTREAAEVHRKVHRNRESERINTNPSTA